MEATGRDGEYFEVWRKYTDINQRPKAENGRFVKLDQPAGRNMVGMRCSLADLMIKEDKEPLQLPCLVQDSKGTKINLFLSHKQVVNS